MSLLPRIPSRALFFVISCFAVLPIACAVSTTSNGGGFGVEPDGGPNASSSGGRGDAGADAAGEDAGAKCNLLEQRGSTTQVVGSAYPAPREGGEIQDGSYVLVGEQVYATPRGGGGEPVDGMARATIRFRGDTLDVVLDSDDYGEQRATYTITSRASQSFHVERTCLFMGNGPSAGIMPLASLSGVNYTAKPTSILFHVPEDSVAYSQWSFTKL